MIYLFFTLVLNFSFLNMHIPLHYISSVVKISDIKLI